MSYPVAWSPRSKITYYNILSYLEEKWTNKEINAFIGRTEEVIEFVKANPFLYAYSKESDTYKSVLTKQITLFYRVKGDGVELLIFWDTRQDSSKLKL